MTLTVISAIANLFKRDISLTYYLGILGWSSSAKMKLHAGYYLTLSPRKAEIPACRSSIYSRKDEISAWKFRKKVLQIMLCLEAPGLGTPCCGSSGVRWF